MPDSTILALDLGTSALKAAIISSRATLIDSEVIPLSILLTPDGGAEQNPADWWSAIVKATQALWSRGIAKASEVIGISSWSSTLVAMVDAMHPLPRSVSTKVVQILGGVGNPTAENHATHLTRRMASLTRGEATFLPTPGITGSAEMARIYLEDPFVRPRSPSSRRSR